MKIRLLKLVAEALWKVQAVAFALRLYPLGAWAINRSCDARNAADFDWKRWAWPAS